MPLWAHADVTVGCLEAGKHVLCEKMMAWDVAGCERMRSAAVATNRVLEIGYQRNYNSMYQAAYEGVIKPGVLGDVYLSRIAWHRNGNWRRKGDPPSPDYNPSKWGYPTFEHLLNWRLYKRYSRGLLAELASHQVNIVNWFFGAEPVATMGTGGAVPVQRRPARDRRSRLHDIRVSGRPDGGVLVRRIERVGSLLRSVLRHEGHADPAGRGRRVSCSTRERASRPPTGIEVTPRAGGPALEASESRVADAAGKAGGRDNDCGGRRPPGGVSQRDLLVLHDHQNRPSAGMRSRSSDWIRARLHHRVRGRRAEGPPPYRHERTRGAHVALPRLLR